MRRTPPTIDGIAVPWYHRYRVTLPEAERGHWRIRIFRVPTWRETPPKVLSSWIGVDVPRLCWPGEYRVLERLTDRAIELNEPVELKVRTSEWVTWMADSPVEIATQAAAIRRMTGRVLIGGLGLGVLVKAALLRGDVTRVDVVEFDEDIIAMVGPHYADPRLHLIHADARTYRPRGVWYDRVYMDIWEGVGACNVLEMIMLRQEWLGRCGWYGAWGEDRAIVQVQHGEAGLSEGRNTSWALERLTQRL